ncbi:MAG: GDP/UDP-N,N'-diacetylbacillosamine 2-epimerase (hydrolyzing) [Flavobacteriaceae bacterium]|jgi:GDP/UDP-N,N'-diacetylbacillosamine 2-epimerase (hydrolysing)
MKIGILTSSRADFGIYYPLIKQLKEDDIYGVEIIAFGTHLQTEYGYTLDEIEKLGFEVLHKIKTPINNNSPKDIATNIGMSIQLFADFWSKNDYDLVFALGDRYEMFAAVTAASTFNIKIAHIHAGETTLGAIDNSYRHSISLMSKYLFVSTEEYKKRAIDIIQRENDVFMVGALSIDNLTVQKFYSLIEFKNRFKIDLSIPTILSTFHPETVSFEKNENYIDELIKSFQELEDKYQIIITMPNSDTMGDMIRVKLKNTFRNSKRVKLVESFGMKGYLSCMKHCSFLLGNTSSGFVEAAFFPKVVINLGDRQKGRIITDNIINCEIQKKIIMNAVNNITKNTINTHCNIYGSGNTSQLIIKKIKELYEMG